MLGHPPARAALLSPSQSALQQSVASTFFGTPRRYRSNSTTAGEQSASNRADQFDSSSEGGSDNFLQRSIFRAVVADDESALATLFARDVDCGRMLAARNAAGESPIELARSRGCKKAQVKLARLRCRFLFRNVACVTWFVSPFINFDTGCPADIFGSLGRPV
jgi:hypothetical protein